MDDISQLPPADPGGDESIDFTPLMYAVEDGPLSFDVQETLSRMIMVEINMVWIRELECLRDRVLHRADELAAAINGFDKAKAMAERTQLVLAVGLIEELLPTLKVPEPVVPAEARSKIKADIDGCLDGFDAMRGSFTELLIVATRGSQVVFRSGTGILDKGIRNGAVPNHLRQLNRQLRVSVEDAVRRGCYGE